MLSETQPVFCCTFGERCSTPVLSIVEVVTFDMSFLLRIKCAFGENIFCMVPVRYELLQYISFITSGVGKVKRILLSSRQKLCVFDKQ